MMSELEYTNGTVRTRIQVALIPNQIIVKVLYIVLSAILLNFVASVLLLLHVTIVDMRPLRHTL